MRSFSFPARFHSARNLSLAYFSLLLLLTGCTGAAPLTLMPTPVIYQNSTVDPFAHLDASHAQSRSDIHYMTNRSPESKGQYVNYGNRPDQQLHFGRAQVQFGPPNLTWNRLILDSLTVNRETELELTLIDIAEMGSVTVTDDETLSPELQQFVDSINKDLSTAEDKEIMVYIHGTKVDFANAAILTAELEHFAGRDFVGIAFAWPSHQNIFSYMVGIDVSRARNSSPALRQLLSVLAQHTTAEQINLLSYSAGGRVTSKALFELREQHLDLSAEQLRQKYRIGSVVFAAADVEIDVFLERLPDISDLARQVLITITDDDNALNAAHAYMGGQVRTGTVEAEEVEEQFIAERGLSNVDILDVSYGRELRGFDITGHHYWYRHPWTSSDMIFLMRTDLPPARRGLSATETEGVWYLSPSYPQQIIDAARIELQGRW